VVNNRGCHAAISCPLLTKGSGACAGFRWNRLHELRFGLLGIEYSDCFRAENRKIRLSLILFPNTEI
jgi:hypothetical protein